MDGFIDWYKNSDGLNQKVTGYDPAWVMGDHTLLLLMPVWWPVQKCMVYFLLDFYSTAKQHVTGGTSLPFTPEFEEGRSKSERGRKLKKLVVCWILFGPQSQWVTCELRDNVQPAYKDKINITQLGLMNSTITFWNTTLEDEACYKCLFNTFGSGKISGIACLTLFGESLWEYIVSSLKCYFEECLKCSGSST